MRVHDQLLASGRFHAHHSSALRSERATRSAGGSLPYRNYYPKSDPFKVASYRPKLEGPEPETLDDLVKHPREPQLLANGHYAYEFCGVM